MARSRGLGDVYKRQVDTPRNFNTINNNNANSNIGLDTPRNNNIIQDDNIITVDNIERFIFADEIDQIVLPDLELGLGTMFKGLGLFLFENFKDPIKNIAETLLQIYIVRELVDNIDLKISDLKKNLAYNYKPQNYELDELEEELTKNKTNFSTKLAIGGIVLVGLFLLYKNNKSENNKDNRINLNVKNLHLNRKPKFN
jgi:hypothetical protein